MMRLCFLHEERFGPVPEDARVLEDWGHVCVCAAGQMLDGRHLYVEADPSVFVRWLGGVDGIWVCEGSPVFQQFKVMHVRDDLVGGGSDRLS